MTFLGNVIIEQAHCVVDNGNFSYKAITLFKDAFEYIKQRDECQRHKHPLKADFNTRHPVVPWNPSENWCITFISPVSPAYNLNCYIITTKDYTKKWFKAKECPTVDTWETTKFLYENIMMRFGCPLKLISD